MTRQQPPSPTLRARWVLAALLASIGLVAPARGEATRLLRQPDVHGRQVAFAYGGDLWTADLAGGEARRLTSTPAVESDPRFSPDGRTIAFTSNRSGVPMVYVVAATGGTPTSCPGAGSPTWGSPHRPAGRRLLQPLLLRPAGPAGRGDFDPVKRAWIAENEGVPPDVEVLLDARSVADGVDPQLERGVKEALRLLAERPPVEVSPPRFSTPARRPRTP